jgi:hypothetical protein
MSAIASNTVKPHTLNYQSVATRGPELHSVKAIALATFLGSIFAGAVLLAINFRRLGKRGMVVPTILAGLAALAVLIGIGFAMPGAPGFIFVIAQIALVRVVATKTQGEALQQHESRGGKIASGWKAAGVGTICLVGVFAVIFAIALLAA